MNDDLHFPVEYWAPLIRVFDERLWNILKDHGFGQSSLTITGRDGKVLDHIFKDEIIIRKKDMKKK